MATAQDSLLKVDAAVGELAEGSLLLQLCWDIQSAYFLLPTPLCGPSTGFHLSDRPADAGAGEVYATLMAVDMSYRQPPRRSAHIVSMRIASLWSPIRTYSEASAIFAIDTCRVVGGA